MSILRKFSSGIPLFPLSSRHNVPQWLRQVKPTIVSRLPSGLRVAVEEMNTQSATVGVWVKAGSRYESAKNNGVAHFLEHLAFKGTRTRSQEQLELEVENMGAHLNAYTSREMTAYFAHVLKDDVKNSLDILADILTNSTFSPHALEAERSVILREAEEVWHQPEESIFDLLHEGAFRGTPLARNILGTERNIRAISRTDILQYIGDRYVPQNIVVAAAGGVKHEEVEKWASEFLSVLPTESNRDADLSHCSFSEECVAEVQHGFPRPHVAIAFRGVGWTHPDVIHLMLFQTLIGNWEETATSSVSGLTRLAESWGSKRLVNSASGFNSCYQDTGLFGVYAVAQKGTLYKVCRNIIDSLKALCTKKLGCTDLRILKEELKSSLLIQLDDTTSVCEDIGRSLIVYGRRIPLAEMFARIDAVDSDALQRAARRYILGGKIAASALGPIPDMPPIEELSDMLRKT